MDSYIIFGIGLVLLIIIMIVVKFVFFKNVCKSEGVGVSTGMSEYLENINIGNITQQMEVVHTPVETKVKIEEKPEFIASEWVGSKEGYVFYMSDKGLGYHLDNYERDSNGEWKLKNNTQ